MTILKVSETWPEIREWLQRVARTLNQSLDRNNSVSTFTLTENTTTTTVTANIASTDNMPNYRPLTANAAAADATTYISERTVGSFTLTHADNAQTDRTFIYSITG